MKISPSNFAIPNKPVREQQVETVQTSQSKLTEFEDSSQSQPLQTQDKIEHNRIISEYVSGYTTFEFEVPEKYDLELYMRILASQTRFEVVRWSDSHFVISNISSQDGYIDVFIENTTYIVSVSKETTALDLYSLYVNLRRLVDFETLRRTSVNMSTGNVSVDTSQL